MLYKGLPFLLISSLYSHMRLEGKYSDFSDDYQNMIMYATSTAASRLNLERSKRPHRCCAYLRLSVVSLTFSGHILQLFFSLPVLFLIPSSVFKDCQRVSL